MPQIIGPILDSSGAPANGYLRVRVSSPFTTSGGHVSQAIGGCRVVDGEPVTSGVPWSLPVTPEGVHLLLEEDLDGQALNRFTVIIPDAPVLTYSQLLFNRGTGASPPSGYWWDLTGGIDFPPGAIEGDLGYDSLTDDVWRYVP